MKKIFLSIMLLFSVSLFAQRGGYGVTGLNFGTNFSKGKSAMTDIEMVNSLGYEFSKNFRVGVAFPVDFLFFRGENQYGVVEKFRLFQFGIGVNINFCFYNNEDFSLRGDFTLAGHSNKYDDWFFTKSVTGIEFYPHRMATQRIKPYVTIGLNSAFSTREFSDKTQKEDSYFTPFIGFGIINKF